MTPLIHHPRRNVIIAGIAMGIIFAAVLLVRGCTSPTWHVSDSRAGGDTLNIAIEMSPIGLSTQGDTLSGYYYDMIRLMAAEHNRPVRIEGFTHLESALKALELGRYDVVVGDIPANSGLRERFGATRAVLIDRQVLVQRRDSAGRVRHQSQLSLAGDTIHIPLNSPFRSRLINLASELGDTIHILEDPELGAEQLIILVAMGELPNVVVNRHLARTMQREYPDLDLSVEISFNQFQSWLVNRRDSILLDTLDAWIAAFADTPQARALTRRYLD